MDVDYLDFFNIETVAGRELQRGDSPWTKGDVAINEKMAEMLGFENPEDAIGVHLEGFLVPIQVRGVVENYHHQSLHHDYLPMAYIIGSWTEYYLIKFKLDSDLPGDERYAQLQGLIGKVEKHWQEVFGNYTMDYFFLNDSYNMLYKSDEQFGKIFGTFSSLAIIIACMGLFGLTSYTLQLRTKEIGIRKVLGASSFNLVQLLSSSYLQTILVSYLVAMPLAWLGMSSWLNNYQFRIDLGVWLLVIPLVTVLLVSFTTIVLRLVKTVRKNPIDSLRYE
jgi:putative ABC transport system permease protein